MNPVNISFSSPIHGFLKTFTTHFHQMESCWRDSDNDIFSRVSDNRSLVLQVLNVLYIWTLLEIKDKVAFSLPAPKVLVKPL